MAPYTEEPLWIDCGGEQMLAIVARPAHGDERSAVLIVPGGPQYRAGSHRQFTQLARALAAAGHVTMRFDVRGMGDSTGASRSFLELDDDICAAGQALHERTRQLPQLMLGLCDAASAILLYLARREARPAGLVLLNPWVRDDVTFAEAQLKHYYGARLKQRDFWRKLARGNVDFAASLRSLWSYFRTVSGPAAQQHTYQQRMADGLRRFPHPVLLITSGYDLTAREFSDYAAREPAWRGLLERPQLTHRPISEADHTFSSAAAAAALHARTIDWLDSLVTSHVEAVPVAA